MADMLQFPPHKRITEVCIEIDADNKYTEIVKYHHKSGNINIYIETDSIEAGAAALNNYLAGTAETTERYL